MHPRATEFAQRAREEHDLDLAVEEFPEGTKTAVDAAEALDCDVAQIASSIVFTTADTVVVITSGTNRVSELKLAETLGVDPDTVGMADPEKVRETVGYSIGGVPPFCHDGDVPTYMDEDLLAHETVWAAAGTPQTVFPINPERLCEVADAEPADVAE